MKKEKKTRQRYKEKRKRKTARLEELFRKERREKTVHMR